MATNLKEERWVIQDGDMKRYLDRYFYDDGTVIYNLRKRCSNNTNVTNWNQGKELYSWRNNTALSWVINADGVIRNKLKNKSNRQEKGEGIRKGDFNYWYDEFCSMPCPFKLVATIRKVRK